MKLLPRRGRRSLRNFIERTSNFLRSPQHLRVGDLSARSNEAYQAHLCGIYKMALRSLVIAASLQLSATFYAVPAPIHGAPRAVNAAAGPSMVLGRMAPPSPLDLFSSAKGRPEVLYEQGTRVDFQMETLHLTKRRVSGGVLVKAAPDAVWNVLTDYERMPEVIPNILSNRVTRDERAQRVTIQQESLLSNKLQLRVDMELEAIEQRDRWSLALKRLSGHGFLTFEALYTLKPRPDGSTYLSYAVELVPCPLVPLPLVERKVRKEVPRMLHAMAEVAQRGGSSRR
jgi:carbon monoxide dehydrogenase subunit G